MLATVNKLQSDKKKLLEELDRHKDCDPEVMEQMKEDTVVAREAANRWTGAACLWPPYVIRQAIYVFILWFLLLFLSFFISLPNLSDGTLDVYHTSHTLCGLSANLECRSETSCVRLAENTGHKKSPKSRHLGTMPQLCRAISSQLRHVSTIGRKLVKQHISSTCPHNMVNFAPLAAEIVSLVWGTPANFNGFRIFAALLHGTLVLGISQTLRR